MPKGKVSANNAKKKAKRTAEVPASQDDRTKPSKKKKTAEPEQEPQESLPEPESDSERSSKENVEIQNKSRRPKPGKAKRVPKSKKELYNGAMKYHNLKKEVLASFLARLLLQERYENLMECVSDEETINVSVELENMSSSIFSVPHPVRPKEKRPPPIQEESSDAESLNSHRDDWRTTPDGEDSEPTD